MKYFKVKSIYMYICIYGMLLELGENDPSFLSFFRNNKSCTNHSWESQQNYQDNFIFTSMDILSFLILLSKFTHIFIYFI